MAEMNEIKIEDGDHYDYMPDDPIEFDRYLEYLADGDDDGDDTKDIDWDGILNLANTKEAEAIFAGKLCCYCWFSVCSNIGMFTLSRTTVSTQR